MYDKPTAYVITIPRLINRQNDILSRWKDKVDIEFFTGVDYKDSALDLSLSFTKRIAPHLYIGTSFYMLYKKLLKTNKNMWLIMEDDAYPTEHWNSFDWNSIVSACDTYEMIKLYTPEIERGNIYYKHNNLQPGIKSTKHLGWIGLCAYIITRRGINKMMNSSFGFAPIDKIITDILHWASVVPNIVTARSAGPSYDTT